jgi:hypothetical protein
MTQTEQKPVPRSAKGQRPQYFEDPACDKLHFMVMALIEELSVTRDRLDALERVLDRKRVASRSEVDRFDATDADETERAARRAAYVRKIMKCFADEAAQLDRADPAMSFEDVVDVVSR